MQYTLSIYPECLGIKVLANYCQLSRYHVIPGTYLPNLRRYTSAHKTLWSSASSEQSIIVVGAISAFTLSFIFRLMKCSKSLQIETLSNHGIWWNHRESDDSTALCSSLSTFSGAYHLQYLIRPILYLCTASRWHTWGDWWPASTPSIHDGIHTTLGWCWHIATWTRCVGGLAGVIQYTNVVIAFVRWGKQKAE